jgi:ElaB/YqjD/DUF883 family membrane-anchored ribosome-binding protein
VDHETPEVIEAQMAETRQSLTEKVAALEDSVVGTVQSATTAVSDTVQTVKDAVGETVEAVKSNVTNALDFSHHVREHPWTAVGVAAFAGFVTAYAMPRRIGSAGHAPPAAFVPSATAAQAAHSLVPPPPRAPGPFDTILKRIGDEAVRLGETILEKVTSELQRAVDDGVPRLVDKIPFTSPAGDVRRAG